MKGKIMTTETTSTEASMTPEQFAEDFIKNHSVAELVEQFVMYSKSVDSLQQRLQSAINNSDHYRQQLRNQTETIEEFLKSHISENDSASVGELKDLAEELEIELTKTIKVTFKIEAEYEIVVPLDADEDSISENDFDYSVSYRNNTNDYEETSESYEIIDFETEEM
jgi:seryl-tRNA synthetase